MIRQVAVVLLVVLIAKKAVMIVATIVEETVEKANAAKNVKKCVDISANYSIVCVLDCAKKSVVVLVVNKKEDGKNKLILFQKDRRKDLAMI